jgi:hypothetical protein
MRSFFFAPISTFYYTQTLSNSPRNHSLDNLSHHPTFLGCQRRHSEHREESILCLPATILPYTAVIPS